MASNNKHFCTCGDTKCPFNPNNPKYEGKDFGCDACIRKNLRLGEIPTCMFVKQGNIEGWDDWSIEGFAKFISQNPRSDEERAWAKAEAERLEASYQDK